MVHVMLVQAVVLQFPKYKPNQKTSGKIDWQKLAGQPTFDKLNATNVSIGSTITGTSRQSQRESSIISGEDPGSGV
jgi:hypothetical protein